MAGIERLLAPEPRRNETIVEDGSWRHPSVWIRLEELCAPNGGDDSIGIGSAAATAVRNCASCSRDHGVIYLRENRRFPFKAHRVSQDLRMLSPRRKARRDRAVQLL